MKLQKVGMGDGATMDKQGMPKMMQTH